MTRLTSRAIVLASIEVGSLMPVWTAAMMSSIVGTLTASPRSSADGTDGSLLALARCARQVLVHRERRRKHSRLTIFDMHCIKPQPELYVGTVFASLQIYIRRRRNIASVRPPVRASSSNDNRRREAPLTHTRDYPRYQPVCKHVHIYSWCHLSASPDICHDGVIVE
jgi:hypothetical protein